MCVMKKGGGTSTRMCVLVNSFFIHYSDTEPQRGSLGEHGLNCFSNKQHRQGRPHHEDDWLASWTR